MRKSVDVALKGTPTVEAAAMVLDAFDARPWGQKKHPSTAMLLVASLG